MVKKLLQYAPVQLFSALSIFVLIALHTNYLTVTEYGILAIFTLLIEVVRAFSAQWVNTSLLRLYPEQKADKKNEYLNAGICLLIALFVPAVGAIIMGSYYYDLFSVKSVFLLSIFLLSKILYLFLLDINRLNEKVASYRMSLMIQSISAVLLSFVLLSINPTFYNAINALTISHIISLPLLRLRFRLRWCFDKQVMTSIIKYGTPLMVSGVLSGLSSRVDRLFIADSIGLVATGIYSGISNILLGVMALVFMIVAMPLYPELAQAVGDNNKIIKLHQKYLHMLLFVSMPALCGLCVVAEPLISIFLTPRYLDYGVELFYIMAASVFVMNLRGHYIDHGLQFTLNTKFMPLITGVSLLVNMGILFLVVDSYGLYGAAWAFFVTNIIAILLSMGFSINKGYRYKVGKDAIKTLAACGLMVGVLLLSKQLIMSLSSMHQLIIWVLLGVTSYLFFNIVLNTSEIRSACMKLIEK